MKKEWMSTEETEEYLGVTRRTLYAWRAELMMPHFMVGGVMRYERREVDKWMEKYRQGNMKFIGSV